MTNEKWKMENDSRPAQHLSLIIHDKSVIRPLDTIRQTGRITFVLYIVSDVSQVSATRPDLRDVFECSIQPQMRWMFLKAQAIEYQHVQIAQCFHCSWRNFAQIRRIREIIKSICHDGKSSVNDFERRDLELTTKAERCA